MTNFLKNIKKKIYIYDNKKKKKIKFKPIKDNKINMYVCGPTLNNYVHLGNFRTFIFFDVLYKYLKHLKFKIKYIRNITDIISNIKIKEKYKKYNFYYYKIIVNKFYLNFKNIINKFNLSLPNIEPHSSWHINEQIYNINKIIKKKIAYKKNGSVYLNIKKYNLFKKKYGKLLNNININNQKVKKNKFFKEKKNLIDFVLWKNLNLLKTIKWYSKWSKGIPAW
ncbi:MAG: cysteine--tRNA ligase, partial [Candidatus Shikimatogenerans sp. JK-2022]|nr:cysteine--tRNA ligase [Candidatus Shikimatogenerans bostrichidophilus]